jgi:GNAT superfamily N-acetyltransferase
MLNDPDRRAMFGHSAAGGTTGAEWIAVQLQLQQVNTTVTMHFAWAVVLRESDTVIGWTTLTNINFYEGGEVEVVIDPTHRGRGYGRRALAEVIRWAFEDLVPSSRSTRTARGSAGAWAKSPVRCCRTTRPRFECWARLSWSITGPVVRGC